MERRWRLNPRSRASNVARTSRILRLTPQAASAAGSAARRTGSRRGRASAWRNGRPRTGRSCRLSRDDDARRIARERDETGCVYTTGARDPRSRGIRIARGLLTRTRTQETLMLTILQMAHCVMIGNHPSGKAWSRHLTPHRASGYASTAAIMRENLNRNAHARGENVARRQATIPSRRLGESRRPAAHRPRGQGDLAPARPRRDSHDPRNHGQSGRGNEAPAGGCGQHRRPRLWQARPVNQWPRRGTAERRAGSLTGDR